MVKDEKIAELAVTICECLSCDKCFAYDRCEAGTRANGIIKYMKEWLSDNGEATEIPREG